MAAKGSRCSVLFSPVGKKKNPYITLLSEELVGLGHEIEFADFPKGLFPLVRLSLQNFGVRVLHLHWVDEMIGPALWASPGLSVRLRKLLLVLDFTICRLLGKHIVWTIHNLHGHESTNVERELEVNALVGLAANKVILHSHSALARVNEAYGIDLSTKAHIAPHPGMMDFYPHDEARTEALRQEFGFDHNDFVFLFFGAIRKYKGVKRLVEAFEQLDGENCRLLIVGSVERSDIGPWLEKKAKSDKRICSIATYVLDEDVASFFSLANIVVLPFVETLSSSSVLLAMSFGKPLLLSERARVLDVPGSQGAVYFTNDGFESKLREVTEIDLKEMGANNLEVAKSLTWSKFAQQTSEAYGKS